MGLITSLNRVETSCRSHGGKLRARSPLQGCLSGPQLQFCPYTAGACPQGPTLTHLGEGRSPARATSERSRSARHGHQVTPRAQESRAPSRPRGLRAGLAGPLGGAGASWEQPRGWRRFLFFRKGLGDSVPCSPATAPVASGGAPKGFPVQPHFKAEMSSTRGFVRIKKKSPSAVFAPLRGFKKHEESEYLVGAVQRSASTVPSPHPPHPPPLPPLPPRRRAGCRCRAGRRSSPPPPGPGLRAAASLTTRRLALKPQLVWPRCLHPKAFHRTAYEVANE